MFKLWQRTKSETEEHKVGAHIAREARALRVIRKCVGEAQLYDATNFTKGFILWVDGQDYKITISADPVEASNAPT